jgi:hypothetical protein
MQKSSTHLAREGLRALAEQCSRQRNGAGAVRVEHMAQRSDVDGTAALDIEHGLLTRELETQRLA